MSAAGDKAHAMHGNPLYGVAPASQEPHGYAESSSADSADEQEGRSYQDLHDCFKQPQTKETLETAAAYIKQGFELLFMGDWQRGVRQPDLPAAEV